LKEEGKRIVLKKRMASDERALREPFYGEFGGISWRHVKVG